MIKNYLNIAIRSLLKQKVYTVINVLGLSVGIASCILIVMFVQNEFSYDKHHPNADRIFKVVLERKYPNHITNYAVIPHSYADVLAQDFPEVNEVVRIGGPFNNVAVTYKDERDEEKHFEENFIIAADSNFFQFFQFKLAQGDPKKVLINNSDIVLTEETAKRYFGDADPIGKTLQFFNESFTVTGLCENVPDNSHVKFDFVTRWNDNRFGVLRTNFITFSAHVYILLKPNADPSELEAKFPKMVDTYAAAQIEQDLGKSWEDYKNEGNGYRYFLQPLTSIHLDPRNIEAKMRPGGNINYVYFLISVAGLILIIACINFMNLATARSSERAREVGIRKTMGSLKGQLVAQFLTESIVLSMLSTIIAMGIVSLALPAFNSLTNKNLSLGFNPVGMLALIGIALVVGFLAGSYPAFALSSFNPVAVLKGKLMSNTKGVWLRNGLVVFQFFISIVLIVGTLTVAQQMQFMQSKSLGYNKDQVLVIERVFVLNEKTATFIDEIKRMPGVENAGGSFSMLGREGEFFGAQFLPEGSSEILTTKSTGIDDDFAETIGFEFVEGRGYSKETNDSLSIILNESAIRVLDIKDPIGRKLNQVVRTPEGNITRSFTIIGVVRDFNFQSLRDPITPLTIQSIETFGNNPAYAYVRLKGKEAAQTISKIEALWNELAPGQPFRFQFQDQNLAAQYDAEQRAGHVFALFSGLAIIIACVGLFGLASYTANLRTKEIGVRKVLGASVSSVVLLLTKDFTRLVLIAFLLAVPLSWYIMDNWLHNFAYRVQLGVGVFILAGIIALLISWITVSYQSIKAAVVNPVKSLRSE